MLCTKHVNICLNKLHNKNYNSLYEEILCQWLILWLVLATEDVNKESLLWHYVNHQDIMVHIEKQVIQVNLMFPIVALINVLICFRKLWECSNEHDVTGNVHNS